MRRDVPSLLDVLRLTRLVRRHPEDWPVLHDALLERYGDDYEQHVQTALYYAFRDNKVYAVEISPHHLIDHEHWRPSRRSTSTVKALNVPRYDASRFQLGPFRVVQFGQDRSFGGLGRRGIYSAAVVSFVAAPSSEAPRGRAYTITNYRRGIPPPPATRRRKR